MSIERYFEAAGTLVNSNRAAMRIQKTLEEARDMRGRVARSGAERRCSEIVLGDGGVAGKHPPSWPGGPAATKEILRSNLSGADWVVGHVRKHFVESSPPPASLGGGFAISFEVARSALLARRAHCEPATHPDPIDVAHLKALNSWKRRISRSSAVGFATTDLSIMPSNAGLGS